MLKAIDTLDERELMKVIEESGYTGVVVERIHSKKMVSRSLCKYSVRFMDDGSFGDDPPTGNVWVCVDGRELHLRAEF